MRVLFVWCLTIMLLASSCTRVEKPDSGTVYVELAMTGTAVSDAWLNALETRETAGYRDSLSRRVRPLNEMERGWLDLIVSRKRYWQQYRDSLGVPFTGIPLSDSIRILLGYGGTDDGFTYLDRTVCLDLTALSQAYGNASDSVNSDRIDRIFSHEYTHLLHKAWARKNQPVIASFADSILWECAYEGIGMYRSMSHKWFPVGDSLSPAAREAFKKLYPVFRNRLDSLHLTGRMSAQERRDFHRNLSRGPMTSKWGALPMGVWLAMEANGDDRNLQEWVDKGPGATLELAEKYLKPLENDSPE